MPTLADIYSAIDTAKRKGSDFIRNPGASLQQIAGYGMDRANAARDQLYQATEEEGIGYGPKTKALAQKMAEIYNPMGLTVWHGSPYKFSKFDASKIGTGEGAQAFGHGLYVAENPKVAEQYSKTLEHKTYGKIIQNAPNNFDVFDNEGNKLASNVYYGKARKVKDEFDNKQKGNIYKVDLPDEHIEKMLDYDKTWMQQPESIRNAINVDSLLKYYGTKDMPTSQVMYHAKQNMSPAAFSEFLKNKGIPGIKYFDEVSRDAKEGTRNFVIFPGNEHLLQIQNLNGNSFK